MKWKAYPEYRDSRVEWLDRVPTHWQCYPLKRLVTLVNEKAGTAEELPYIGLENVESWTGRLLETEAESDSLANRFAPTDILFGKLRPYLAKALAPAFAGRCTSELLVLRPHRIERRFLLYCLLSKGFIETVNASTFGVKMPRADWPFIGGLKIGLPSLDEQRAIAAFLDHETARIDAMIAKKERLIALLEEKRTALISQAVTKGLDPNAPMKESGVEWLGRIPEEWELMRIKRIFFVANGSTPDTGTPEFWDGDIVWITPDDLGSLEGCTITSSIRRITDAGYRSCATTLAPTNSIVLSTRAPIGHLAIAGIPLCTNQGCRSLVPRRDNFAKFFYYQLLIARPELRAWGQGSTFTELSASKLGSVQAACPPLSEQRAIAGFLDRETTRIDAMIEKNGSVIEALREYRTALISAAVTGKIDVREE